MPGMYLDFPFDEEIFLMNWQAARDPAQLALINSGAITESAEIRRMISGGSNTYTIPCYNVIGGEPDNYDGDTDITVTEVSGSSQTGVVYGRAHAWRDRDFVHDFNSGADPTKQIASQVSRYWQKRRQITMLKILDGIFGTSDDTGGYLNAWKEHTYDLSAASGAVTADNKMGATTMGDALQKAVGDNSNIFALAWMHSYVANNLAGLELLEYRKYTDSMGIERQLKIADFNGITVVVDDACPTVAADGVDGSEKEYTTYVMGMGALLHAPAPVKTPVEMHRESKTDGGYDELITRFRETYHPNGFTFKLPMSCISPTDEQLGTAANWLIAADPKTIPIARIITNG